MGQMVPSSVRIQMGPCRISSARGCRSGQVLRLARGEDHSA